MTEVGKEVKVRKQRVKMTKEEKIAKKAKRTPEEQKKINERMEKMRAIRMTKTLKKSKSISIPKKKKKMGLDLKPVLVVAPKEVVEVEDVTGDVPIKKRKTTKKKIEKVK